MLTASCAEPALTKKPANGVFPLHLQAWLYPGFCISQSQQYLKGGDGACYRLAAAGRCHHGPLRGMAGLAGPYSRAGLARLDSTQLRGLGERMF